MTDMGYFQIIVTTIFVNNILLAQFLGNCPFLGTSKKMETATGMSMAVVFVLVMAGVITWIPPDLASAGSDVLQITAAVTGTAAMTNTAEVTAVDQNDPDCERALLDTDGDVDQGDFAIFRTCMTGPGVPGDPDCGP